MALLEFQNQSGDLIIVHYSLLLVVRYGHNPKPELDQVVNLNFGLTRPRLLRLSFLFCDRIVL